MYRVTKGSLRVIQTIGNVLPEQVIKTIDFDMIIHTVHINAYRYRKLTAKQDMDDPY